MVKQLLNLALSILTAGLLLFAGCAKHESAVERGNREQILERGSHADVTDLDPQTAVTITELDIASSLFEGLVSEDPVDLHPVPGVAERWDVSADGLTYRFHLRPSARWSDGTPVTADDFVASWKRMLTRSLGARNVTLLYVIQGAEAFHKGVTTDFSQTGVTAVDAHTLQVTLEHPTSYFLSLLTHAAWYPVPVSTIAKYGPVDQPGNRWTKPGQLVGNGPFVLKTWRPNQEILVEKSPTYWDAAQVRLQAIRFHPIDSVDAEERAFRAGQLHVTYVVPFTKAETYRREAPQLLRSDAYLNTYLLRLNTTRAPFDDERVRRAFSLAIDRTTLVEKVLRGGQKPAVSLTPPGMPGYTPPAGPGFDPVAARQLFEETAFGRAQDRPKIELLFNTSENLRVVAEALQAMWKSTLGIEVELVNQEYKVVLAERAAGRYQILLGDWVADYVDPSAFLDMWVSGNPSNATGWSNVDFDGLLFAAARNPDPASRVAQLQKAEGIVLNACPAIPIYFNAHTFLLQPAVKGWYPTLLDHHPYKHVWLEP